MTINERFALVRKSEGMSMDKFGEPLGIKKSGQSHMSCLSCFGKMAADRRR